jgi:ubiquinone biosynthesis protein UbiJ
MAKDRQPPNESPRATAGPAKAAEALANEVEAIRRHVVANDERITRLEQKRSK